jgi:hypothetical protein
MAKGGEADDGLAGGVRELRGRTRAVKWQVEIQVKRQV